MATRFLTTTRRCPTDYQSHAETPQSPIPYTRGYASCRKRKKSGRKQKECFFSYLERLCLASVPWNLCGLKPALCWKAPSPSPETRCALTLRVLRLLVSATPLP